MIYRVTQILNNCNFREWEMSEKDKEFYFRRGSMIHKACELYDKNILDWNTVDERIKGFVRAWVNFREQVGGTIIEIEQEVENKPLGYRGRLDRIITNSNLVKGYWLIDIKTNEADIFCRLQTMAYAMAQKKKVRRGHVALKSDGRYSVEVYQDDNDDRAAFMACLTLNSWKERNK